MYGYLIINRYPLSRPDTKADIRNYFRQMAREIYSEQTPETKRRIDKIGTRIRNTTKRLDPVREGTPMGKAYIRRHLIGQATNVAEMLDGEAGKNVRAQAHRQQRKVKSRKSRVVK